VLALETHIAWQQNGWQQYFRKRRIEPLVVEYEALAQNYRGEIARVLSFLDLDHSAARSIPPPHLIRQADEISVRWRRLMELAHAPTSPQP
jgi:LPS sulfotransferase NodH